LQVKKEKIRVLRIINRFNIGGPTYNATFLTKFLSDDFETLLIGGLPEPDESDSLHIPREYGIDPILIPELKRAPNPFDDRKAYRRIKQIIEDFKPHIVHTHASKAGALGRKAAFSMNVPVVVHTFHGHVFHSYFGKAKTLFYKTIERYLAARSTRVIAISEGQAKELSIDHQICKREKIAVVPLGFDLTKFNEHTEEKRMAFRQTYGLDDQTIAICIVGRLVPIKNHGFLIQAIKRLKEETKHPVKLFIVGDGEERANIESMILDAGLSYSNDEQNTADITFTSWIKDVDRVYAGCDIVTLCSLNEGTPVSLIEAQAAGLPIVSTRVGGIQNVVLENETAFLTAKDDLEAFTKFLKILVEQEDKRLAMSEKGWEFVKDNFHFTRLVKDMDTLYQKLLMEKAVKW